MTQSLFSQAMESSQPIGFDGPANNSEFNYRPVPVLAPVSLALGFLSAFGFIGLLAVPIGLIGVIVSVICILKLRRTRGEYGGMWLAVTGLVLSFACFTTSGAL